MEIYNDNMIIDLSQISVKDFRKETEINRENLPQMDFTSIKLLQGEKKLLGLAFNKTKKELLK
jgi:hypothetical protein